MIRDPIQEPRIWDYGYLLTKKIREDLKWKLPKTGKLWVDIGCGSQPHRRFYPPSTQIVNFDVNSKLPNILFQASADFIPIRSKSCDVALVLTVLQCVDNPNQSIQEAARILKPRGILVVLEMQDWQTYSEFDRFRFTPNGLKYLGSQAGLKLISIKPQGSFFARWGCRFNRALLPYSDSSFKVFSIFLAPLIIFNNIYFGLLDRLFPFDGEAVSNLAIFEKPKNE